MTNETYTALQQLYDLELSENSHKTINVLCEYSVSQHCRLAYEGAYRDIVITAKNHNNKICCFNCSRILKASHASRGSGRNNSNCKYKNLNDKLFSIIDTQEKAYILGWIASDGHVGKGQITITSIDEGVLCDLRDNVCEDLPVKKLAKDGHIIYRLSVCSKQIAEDVKNHLKLISFGKKDTVVNFPNLQTEDLSWAFVRGYFDGDGSVNLADGSKHPGCDITSNSKLMRGAIEKFAKIPCSNSDVTNRMYWSGSNALDFLEKIYRTSSSTTRLHRKYTRYLEWCNWVPSLAGSGRNKYESALHSRWSKTTKDAIAPFKERASDSGYDLTLLSIWKKIGMITFYDTGIKVLPDFGWYFMLVPRSSLAKSGYMLANSVGIIDRTYIGTIKVPLIKIDDSLPDIELPLRAVQIIPCPAVHAQMVEVKEDELDESSRSTGGFGSTT